MTDPRSLVNSVLRGTPPMEVIEKVLLAPYPSGYMQEVVQFIQGHPTVGVDDVVERFPLLVTSTEKIPGWISDALAGRTVL